MFLWDTYTFFIIWVTVGLKMSLPKISIFNISIFKFFSKKFQFLSKISSFSEIFIAIRNFFFKTSILDFQEKLDIDDFVKMFHFGSSKISRNFLSPLPPSASFAIHHEEINFWQKNPHGDAGDARTPERRLVNYFLEQKKWPKENNKTKKNSRKKNLYILQKTHNFEKEKIPEREILKKENFRENDRHFHNFKNAKNLDFFDGHENWRNWLRFGQAQIGIFRCRNFFSSNRNVFTTRSLQKIFTFLWLTGKIGDFFGLKS